MCPTDPEDWKKIEQRFRNRWNLPHAVGALDGKHIAIKKPKKVGQRIFQLQGLFLSGTFGFSQCRLQVPVGQHWGQWVII